MNLSKTSNLSRMSETAHQSPVPANPIDDGLPRCLVDLEITPQAIVRALAALDWSFTAARSDELTHGLHPYPAKFIPSLPRQAIAALSRRGELILDPFSGGGTTAVEALATERGAYSIDANPV